MQRYFVEQNISDLHQQLMLDAEQTHHIVKVMRMKLGDAIYVVDRNQQVYIAVLRQIHSDGVIVEVTEQVVQEVELPVHISIAVGLSKGDKLEWITQKATELGVCGIIPLAMNRDTVKWSGDKSEKKRSRLQKIAQEAAEQSHRAKVPEIYPLHTLEQLTSVMHSMDYTLVAYEESARAGEKGNLVQVLERCQAGERLLLIFGSEGGLDSNEIERLVSFGAKVCGLGPRIMRAETAPIYALSAISYALELQSNLKK